MNYVDVNFMQKGGEKMKKIRNIFVVTVVLLTVISMGSVAGTYAKYTASETDTDTARVAKWDVKFGGGNTFDFNLFNTILDSNGGAEDDVKDGKPTENIIAPGTSGAFTIDITNDSEVNADVFATFEETNTSNIPLEYKVTYTPQNGGTPVVVDWTNTIANVKLENANLPFDTTSNSNKGTIKFEWRWVYEKGDNDAAIDANDANDNTLGKAGSATATIKATLRATQRD